MSYPFLCVFGTNLRASACLSKLMDRLPDPKLHKHTSTYSISYSFAYWMSCVSHLCLSITLKTTIP